MKPLLFDVKSLLEDSIYIKEIDLPQLDDQFHFHNTYEIALIIKGKGKRIIGDNIENFTDGDLIMLGPHTPHVSYHTKEEGRYIKALVIYFHPDWLTDNLLSSINLIKLRKLFINAQRGIQLLGNTRKQIIKILTKLKSKDGLERVINMLQILDIISRSKEYSFLASQGYSSYYNDQDTKRIDAVYKYVLENFTEKIMLQDVAAIAHMTSTAFCKYFKKKTKKTFSTFVNEVKIGYACKLLCNEDLNISEVCYKCGYNNLANFNRNFKNITTMIASKYKVKIKE